MEDQQKPVISGMKHALPSQMATVQPDGGAVGISAQSIRIWVPVSAQPPTPTHDLNQPLSNICPLISV